MPMIRKLHYFVSASDNELTTLKEPKQETLAVIMRFAAAFRSIKIAENCHVNYVLN